MSYIIAIKTSSVRVESANFISSPCTEVWKKFIDLNSWDSWSSSLSLRKPIPSQVKLGDRLELKAQHTLWFNPFNPFHIDVTVCELIPEKSLVWEGSPFGTYGKHGFTFEAVEEGCRLHQWEEGFGPMAKLGLKIGVFDSIGRIHLQFFKDFKDICITKGFS